MNKKTLTMILVTLIVFTILGVFLIINRQEGPAQIVNKAISSDSLQEYYDKDLLESIVNSGGSSTEFLKENVSNFETKASIKSVKEVQKSSSQATVIVEMRKESINKKTRFTVVTIDTYEVNLVKADNAWKINGYKLVKSETNK